MPAARVWLAGDGFAADLDRDQFASLPDFDEQILSNQDAWGMTIRTSCVTVDENRRDYA